MRQGKVERNTKETRILVELDLDGTGKADISTGVGFLDHMLTLLAVHSFMDLKVRAQGTWKWTATIRWKMWASPWARPLPRLWGTKRHPPVRQLPAAHG